MRTLAIISQKGGSGKTTIAVHMAVCAALGKLKTAILDIDPQHSAYGWNESRPEERKLDAVAADAGQLDVLLRQAEAAGVALAIIDTAPHSSGDAAVAAKLADLVLIPCRPARFDLDAVGRRPLKLPRPPTRRPSWSSMPHLLAGRSPTRRGPRLPAKAQPY